MDPHLPPTLTGFEKFRQIEKRKEKKENGCKSELPALTLCPLTSVVGECTSKTRLTNGVFLRGKGGWENRKTVKGKWVSEHVTDGGNK